MVREVIPDCNTRSHAPQLHAAPDPFEAREGFDGPNRVDPGSLRRGDRRERVLKVVPALQVRAHKSNEPALIEYLETARADHARTPPFSYAKAFHRAPTAACKDAVNRRVGAVDYEFTGPRYRSDKVMKLGLDRCKIAEDISMIELNVVQNGNPRPVMHHLGTLIEEGSIVFVGFDHEMALFSQLRRNPEIERYTPDEKAGGQSRIYQNPSQHRGRRCFSVCPGYCQDLPAEQGIFSEPLRTRNVAIASVQYELYERIAARDDIPNHPQVRIQRGLISTIPYGQFDAFRFKLRTHRRVHVDVASCDAVAPSLGDRGDAAHESAADAKDVDVHGPGRHAPKGRRARGPKKGNNSSLLRCVFRLRYHGPTPACSPMPKESKLKQQQMRTRIAAAAARMMAEDGLEDFALAKRKAARQLGAVDTQALPKNEEIEAELRAYQSLYQGEEQRERIHYLRERALEAMRLLEQFRPYLAGAVLRGTAGRYSDIDLQLFTDDGKAVEFFLLSRNIAYDISDQRHFAGDQARAVSVLKLDWQGVPVNLAIYTLKEERGTLKTTLAGRPIERAGIQAVTQLLSPGGD